MFSSLQDFVAKNSADSRELFAIMSQHLKGLVISFCLFFSKNKIIKKGNFCIANPFIKNIKSCNPNAAKKESLIELVCDAK